MKAHGPVDRVVRLSDVHAQQMEVEAPRYRVFESASNRRHCRKRREPPTAAAVLSLVKHFGPLHRSSYAVFDDAADGFSRDFQELNRTEQVDPIRARLLRDWRDQFLPPGLRHHLQCETGVIQAEQRKMNLPGSGFQQTRAYTRPTRGFPPPLGAPVFHPLLQADRGHAIMEARLHLIRTFFPPHHLR